MTRQEVNIIHLPGGLVRNRVGPVLADPTGDIWVSTWGLTRISNGVFHLFVRKRSSEKWFDAQ